MHKKSQRIQQQNLKSIKNTTKKQNLVKNTNSNERKNRAVLEKDDFFEKMKKISKRYWQSGKVKNFANKPIWGSKWSKVLITCWKLRCNSAQSWKFVLFRQKVFHNFNTFECGKSEKTRFAFSGKTGKLELQPLEKSLF